MTMLNDSNLYTIGWIAALPIERAAAIALLDERHGTPERFEQHQSDTNSYAWGRVGVHNVVIASLPAGVCGTTSTATTAANLLSSLPQIRIGLLVGIGGGVARPDQDYDIRLGDVVVSQPQGTEGGVVQYDFFKATTNESWERKGCLNMPPPILLNALASLQAEHEIAPSKIPNLLQRMWAAHPHMKRPKINSPAYVHQGIENDRLFISTYNHTGGSTCTSCHTSKEVKRKQRATTDPEIHYGIIASGNKVIKDAATRDQIAGVVGEDCICFEMEAAGLMNHFPCLVIRGICDYADSHKNGLWQRYASATAAAFAKELLGFIPTQHLKTMQGSIGIFKSISKDVESIESITTDIKKGAHNIHTVVLDIDRKVVLARLEDEVAAGAAFDSPAELKNSTCLPNTRVELLQQISAWAEEPGTEPVLWLNGMAGTGKSTVARTVAHIFAAKNRLGASFFFKRGETDRGSISKFFSSIAADLTRRVTAIASYVKDAIDSDPAIFRKTMQEQFEKLVLQPLSMIQSPVREKESILIIIDALDECDQEDDIKRLLHLVTSAKCLQAARLRIFLTSRPELPIRLGFTQIESRYHSIVLHEVSTSVVEQDICVFLEHELSIIRGEYNASVPEYRRLATNWPGQPNIRSLVKMAVPLFIFAATVCRFVADRKCGNPDQQLQEVLQFKQIREGSQMNATYLPILNRLVDGVSGKRRDEVLRQFRYIVGSIVILGTPLSTAVLAQVLNTQRDVIDARLDLLHSVLSIPSSANAPVRLFHLSFRDFLLDPNMTAKIPFRIDGTQAHQMMAVNCLRLMECLRQDICDVRGPGIHRSAIHPTKVRECLPPEIQYACLYWVYHVQGAGNLVVDVELVHSFLKRHFLHWVESLSLIGRAWEIPRLVKSLQSFYKYQDDKQLAEFLDDAVRFVIANPSVIDTNPLQIYSSLLIFSPTRSKVRTTFNDKIPRWISLQPRVHRDWGQCLQTFEGHGTWVRSVSFSQDSAFVASGSDDKTIRIWHTATGECRQILKGHGKLVSSVAFSHDSVLVASGSHDGAIRIWRTATGECMQTLEGHESCVTSVAFSHHSALLISGSYDNTTRIWRTDTGECIQTLGGHNNWVTSVAFSHDSALVVSGSHDNTIRIWCPIIGKCIQTLEGHDSWVTSVTFSHDSAFIASGSRDNKIRIWCVGTGRCVQTHGGHGDFVESVAFSHDSAIVASGSSDGTIRMWDISTGECLQTLTGHGDWVESVAFSHDSTLIASGSRDNTIRFWHTTIAKNVQIYEGHSSCVESAVFSHDSQLVASGSRDTMVRIWRTATGECVQTLKGHNNWIRSIAFSHDSTLIASGSRDTMIRIWHTATGECTQTLEGHSSWVTSVAFSHDSALIASGSRDNTIRIWRLATGKCVQTLEEHGSWVESVVFCSDSALIASGSRDHTLRIWRVTTGECVQTLEGHDDWVESVAFSHDSALVSSGSSDNTIRIWRVATGDCVQILSIGLSTSRFFHCRIRESCKGSSFIFQHYKGQVLGHMEREEITLASKGISSLTIVNNWDAASGDIRIHSRDWM
ncbi:G-protein beta wd-40 repeats containing [Pochonia chlamydosporia 170]|uniref:Mitochondrial division protein 1 n=1 Tax=Pochonia chlamydosporia 170 TaxID=1380566 RepID=A0A219ASP2_METCM|nr:G-protein beta wd-40 repeats containing [Pochonia chlamydosporia 170]OWT43619.1 G-protein beta wd-40 repeats containing [Pochonia chlamydosporia 170]